MTLYGAESLTELTRTLRAPLLGIAFDIDDTLTKDGYLQVCALEALWALRGAGFKLVAATGRPLGWADVIVRQWPVDAVVGENGGGWLYSRGEKSGFIHSAEVRSRNAEQRVELAHELRAAHAWCKLALDNDGRRTDTAFDIGETQHLSDEQIATLERAIAGRGLHSFRSSVHLHACLPGYDKAVGLQRAIADALGIDLTATLERWIYVGDSSNDAACFSRFPWSVGVANVREAWSRLPKPPRYVTRHSHGDGFAELAAQLTGG